MMDRRDQADRPGSANFESLYTASGGYRSVARQCLPIRKQEKSPAAMAGLFVFRAPQLVG
jgi:hypothetical protein